MIRRISKHNDLRDIVRSCPSGVIDDIYSIKYYIQGHNEVIDAEFSKVGRQLEVIIPSSKLELLPNGILMRRAFYKVLDSSYPDGYYNLEFEESTNVWLGEEESEEPVIPEYVTEEELYETLSSYTTQEWISEQGYLTAGTLPSDIATQEWVESQGYLTSHQDLTGYATESWVQNQGYITSENIPSGIATQSWVENQGYLTAVPSGYATESWVQEQGYLTSHQDLTGYATESWVENQGYLTSTGLSGLATQSWVEEQGYATESWIGNQGYITASTIPSDIATESYVSSALSGYATESWVGNQGYLTAVPAGYATESWVLGRGYLTTVPSGYATESWVSSQISDIMSNTVQFDATFNIPAVSNYGSEFIVIKSQTSPGIYNTVVASYSGSYVNMGIARYEYLGGIFNQAGFDPFATQSWVQSQGYLTSVPAGYATQSWVTSQGYLSATALSSVLSSYATLDYVVLGQEAMISRISSAMSSAVLYSSFMDQTINSVRSYVIDATVDGLFIAGKPNWSVGGLYVSSNGNLYKFDMNSYWESSTVYQELATQNWVSAELSDYATKSWVSSNYLADSKVWCGTREQWDRLTPEEKATYKIALVTA